ncbi:MAG: ATP-dependent DNA helicase RecQ, partial [Bacteroidetes bacterium]
PLTFPSVDGSYYRFKWQLLGGEATALPEQQTLVVDPSALVRNLEATMQELRLLLHLFQLNGRQLTLLRKVDRHKEYFRDDFRAILQEHWQSDSFRALRFYAQPDRDREKVNLTQGTVIESIVTQAEKAMKGEPYTDLFLTAPTGAGKSLLFQIPALYLARHHQSITIVVSPLKALMYDQVTALQERGVQEVAFINSDISLQEREDTLHRIHQGEISIVYLSPELLLAHPITHFVGERPLGLLVVDEAHLVTTWGRDFRVDYWYLGHYLRKLRSHATTRFPIVALTATAAYGGAQDLVFDTVSSLNMRIAKLFIGNVRRDEIVFDIEAFDYEDNHEQAKLKQTKTRVEAYLSAGTKTIVYYPWTNQIVKTFELLEPAARRKTGKYYGSVSQTERKRVADSFKAGELRAILATKAFGMGIDIQDIEVIYHHAPSGNLADYVQEVGRVARDPGLKGITKVDFHPKDLKFTRILNALSAIRQYQVRLMLQKLAATYQLKDTANLEVSVEDFTYLFPKADIDQKVKSALLLLEKDLETRFGYPVLLVRPRALSSIAYARIAPEGEAEFMDLFGEFAEKVAEPSAPKAPRKLAVPAGYNIKPIMKQKAGGGGAIYQLRLDKIWETHFREESFPIAQKKFFEKKLFGELNEHVLPQLQLSVRLPRDRAEVQAELDGYFKHLEAALVSFGPQTYFTRPQLEQALVESIPDDSLRRRVTDLMVTLYAGMPQSFGQQRGRRRQQPEVDTFLQLKRYAGGEPSMRFDDRAYRKVQESLAKKWTQLFPKDDDRVYTGYVTTDPAKNMRTLKLAYLLETFQMGSYELAGGKHARIFVRVNDPEALISLANSEYENTVIKENQQRQAMALDLMEYFFTTEMEDSARWDFIEDYFLGRDPTHGALDARDGEDEAAAEDAEAEELDEETAFGVYSS